MKRVSKQHGQHDGIAIHTFRLMNVKKKKAKRGEMREGEKETFNILLYGRQRGSCGHCRCPNHAICEMRRGKGPSPSLSLFLTREQTSIGFFSLPLHPAWCVVWQPPSMGPPPHPTPLKESRWHASPRPDGESDNSSRNKKKRHRFKRMWFKAYPLKSNLRTRIALTSHVLRHKARRKKNGKRTGARPFYYNIEFFPLLIVEELIFCSGVRSQRNRFFFFLAIAV